MRHTILILLMLITFQGFGQRMSEYTASNGITYREGDVIELGAGSGANGEFVFVTMGGWAAGSVDNPRIGANYAGTGVDIKKIRKQKFKGVEKVVFTVGGGNITNYWLSIEQAIEACEIKDCNKETAPAVGESKLDRLKQLKDLLDMGAITEAEFEKMKKDIINE